MGKLPSIALGDWAIAKGTLPIIGVTKEAQVLDAVRAAGIALTDEEVSEHEKTADSPDLNLVRMWEKEMKRKWQKRTLEQRWPSIPAR